MNTDVIEKEFEKLLAKRGIYKMLGITSGDVRNYRYKLANGEPIKLETKLKLLQKSGWRQDDVKYTTQDLVSLINFYNKTSQAARNMGAEYVIEKWAASK